MANVLTIPNSGIISFDGRSYSNLSVLPLSSAPRITYDQKGGLNISSYVSPVSASERLSVDGNKGRLFTVVDSLTGVLFSVGDIAGLPILEVKDTDTVIAGAFNTNALVVSGNSVGIRTIPNSTNALTVNGTISTSQHGTSQNWSRVFSTVQTNSANWEQSESFQIESDGSFYDTSFINLKPIRPEVPLNSFYNYGTYTFTNLITSKYTSFEGNIILNSELKNPTKYFNIKNIEYFNGNITVTSYSSLTSLTFPKLKACTGTITITNNNALSALEVNELEFVNNIILGGYAPGAINTELQRISFPKLKFVAGALNFEGSRAAAGHQAVLRELNFPALEQIGSTAVGNFTLGSATYGNTTYPSLTSVTFSNLRMANLITLRRCPSLSAISFPNLRRVSEFTLHESTALRDVNLPELAIIAGYFFSTAAYPNLTALNLPKLELITHGGVMTFNMSQLSSINLGNNILRQVAVQTLTFATSLNQTSVDNILKTFAGLDGTGLTDLYGTSRTLSLGGSNSAPSYTGGVTTTAIGSNFVRTGTTVVASVTTHGHTTGDIVTFTGNSQSALNGTYTVTVNNANEFQYTTSSSGSLTGGIETVTMRRTTVATDGFRYFQTIALRGATVTITNP